MKYIFTLFLASYAFFSANAQCDTSKNVIVTIVVNTDSFPQDNGWLLASNDNSGIIAVTPPGTYTEPHKKYTHEFCIPKNKCLRLFLTDTKGDGVEYPGYVKVSINGKQVAYINFFEYAYFEYLNCSTGESCGTPQDIGEGDFKTDFNNQYYLFTPKQSGFYKISTCDTTNTCDTKIWIYEECRTFNPQNNVAGTIMFSDDNGGCGKLANFPQAVLEKNKPYIIRIGGDTCKNTPIKWSIHYSGGISGCMDTAACNYNYLATIPTNDCIPQNDTTCKGPDLIVLADAIENSLVMDEVNADNDPCLINEGCLNGFGMRNVLRFDTKIRNIGDQDYFIGKPYGSPTQFVFDNCHQHYHYRGYAEYLLFDDIGNRIPIGFKAGFCVLDFECQDTSNMKYNCVNMGLSTKCTDIYEKELACQWIDITNIPAGKYFLVARVNWDNSPDKLGRVESRTDNNWAQVCVQIKRQGDSVWVEKETLNCKPYVDCKGIKYGASVNDCNGVCGGTAQRGDLNNNNLQDSDDIQKYIKQAVNQSGTASICTDLNADGRISVSDAALLSSCLNYGKKHTHIGSSSYHDHCRFPQNIVNQKDTVYFKIQNYNPIGKYFDVAMHNPSTNVNGYQLEFSGVSIAKVISLVDTVRYPVKPSYGLTSRIVGSLSLQDSVIRKSASFKPLLRVFFSNQATTKVEIISASDITDRDAFQAIGKVHGQSIFVSSNKDLPLMDLNVLVQPNPMINSSLLSFYNPENELFKLEIFDLSGKNISIINNIRNDEVLINTENFATGIYFYKLSGAVGFATGKLVVQK